MLVDFRGLVIKDLDGVDVIEKAATDGKPAVYLTFARAVSSMLISEKAEDPVKMYEMALNFRKNEAVEMDSTDLDFFEKAVKASTNYVPLVTGQVLLKVRQLKVLDADDIAKKKAASNEAPAPQTP